MLALTFLLLSNAHTFHISYIFQYIPPVLLTFLIHTFLQILRALYCTPSIYILSLIEPLITNSCANTMPALPTNCYDFEDIVLRSDEYLDSRSEKLR